MNENPEETVKSPAFDGKIDPERTADRAAFLLLLFPSCCFLSTFFLLPFRFPSAWSGLEAVLTVACENLLKAGRIF